MVSLATVAPSLAASLPCCLSSASTLLCVSGSKDENILSIGLSIVEAPAPAGDLT